MTDSDQYGGAAPRFRSVVAARVVACFTVLAGASTHLGAQAPVPPASFATFPAFCAGRLIAEPLEQPDSPLHRQ